MSKMPINSGRNTGICDVFRAVATRENISRLYLIHVLYSVACMQWSGKYSLIYLHPGFGAQGNQPNGFDYGPHFPINGSLVMPAILAQCLVSGLLWISFGKLFVYETYDSGISAQVLTHTQPIHIGCMEFKHGMARWNELNRKLISLLYHYPVYKWGLWCQNQVSQTGISNCIPHYSVGCNYLSMPEMSPSVPKVLNSYR